MSGALDAFDGYRQLGVTRFVQSAVVIDNEAEMRARPPAPSRPSGQAARASASLLNPAVVTSPNAEPIARRTAADDDAEPSHELDAKMLTDAGSEREVICGLYRPEPGEDMVRLATRAAAHADVVILDWFLERASSVKARQIIVEILKSDLKDKGRLRLLAVYTSQAGISGIAKEVFDAVEEVAELKQRLTLDGAVLTGPSIRICILSKKQTPGSSDVDKVDESLLPKRLIEEFSRLSTGLLTSFALHSIAAVRRSAHHVVAVFREELDGAYVGHRCSIDDPDDAREFAVDLIVGELRNVIAVDEMAEGCMTETVLEAWVDRIAGEAGFTVQEEVKAPSAVVKGLVRGGAGALKAVRGSLVDRNAKQVDGTIKFENVGGLFYRTPDDAWNSHLEFARLSSFKREAFGRTQLPGGFRPTLTLGSVLKLLGPINEADQAKYAGLSGYYVCMQPRCDSVRLEQLQAFPFQTAEAASGPFNLVVKERGLASGTPLMMSGKLSELVLFRFKPDEVAKVVKGELREDGFVFKDDLEREFLWLGDIRDLKAQQDASALAANVHRVGLDEHEWLRRAARKDAKINFRPTS